MSLDVPAVGPFASGRRAVLEAGEQADDLGTAVCDPPGSFDVADQYAYQRGEVVAVPPALDVALAQADRAPAEEGGVGTRIETVTWATGSSGREVPYRVRLAPSLMTSVP